MNDLMEVKVKITHALKAEPHLVERLCHEHTLEEFAHVRFSGKLCFEPGVLQSKMLSNNNKKLTEHKFINLVISIAILFCYCSVLFFFLFSLCSFFFSWNGLYVFMLTSMRSAAEARLEGSVTSTRDMKSFN